MTIQPSAWRRPLAMPILGSSLLTLLAFFIGLGSEASVPAVLAVVVCIGFAIFLITMLALTANFPRVQLNELTGNLRVNGRDFHFRSITATRRSLKRDKGGGPGYVIYRFDVQDEPSFRLLVAGRPYPGLASQNLQALDDFLGRLDSPKISNREGRDAEVVAGLTGSGKAVETTPHRLRVEVAELLGVEPPEDGDDAPRTSGTEPDSAVGHHTTPAHGTEPDSAVGHHTTPAHETEPGSAVGHHTTPAHETEPGSAVGHQHSTPPSSLRHEALANLDPGPRRTKRLTAIVLGVAAAGVFGFIVYASVMEGRGDLDADADAVVRALTVMCLAACALAGYAWILARDAYLQQQRAAAEEWLATGAGRRDPHIAGELESLWEANARTAWIVASVLAWIAGPLIALVGIALLLQFSHAPAAGIAGIGIGVAITVGAGGLRKRYRRLRELDARRLVALLGD